MMRLLLLTARWMTNMTKMHRLRLVQAAEINATGVPLHKFKAIIDFYATNAITLICLKSFCCQGRYHAAKFHTDLWSAKNSCSAYQWLDAPSRQHATLHASTGNGA